MHRAFECLRMRRKYTHVRQFSHIHPRLLPYWPTLRIICYLIPSFFSSALCTNCPNSIDSVNHFRLSGFPSYYAGLELHDQSLTLIFSLSFTNLPSNYSLVGGFVLFSVSQKQKQYHYIRLHYFFNSVLFYLSVYLFY